MGKRSALDAELGERQRCVRLIKGYSPSFISPTSTERVDVFALKLVEMVKKNIIDLITDEYIIRHMSAAKGES